MAITIPTVDEFTESTVMLVIREIAEYICGDNGLVAQINNNDITGFTSSYTNNVLKIDATKGDGSTLPVCNVTIEGGSSTGNPYPTGVSGTVGSDGNITFNITMSSGSPLTTTINMNYFASTADLSDLQEQVTGLALTSSGNTMSINGTSAPIVNSISGEVVNGNLKLIINGVTGSDIPLPESKMKTINVSGNIDYVNETIECNPIEVNSVGEIIIGANQIVPKSTCEISGYYVYGECGISSVNLSASGVSISSLFSINAYRIEQSNATIEINTTINDFNLEDGTYRLLIDVITGSSAVYIRKNPIYKDDLSEYIEFNVKNKVATINYSTSIDLSKYYITTSNPYTFNKVFILFDRIIKVN